MVLQEKFRFIQTFVRVSNQNFVPSTNVKQSIFYFHFLSIVKLRLFQFYLV